MKPRLFWKILIAYWLTFALTTSAMFVAFLLQTHGGRDLQSFELRIRNERVAAASMALKLGGEPALAELTATWPEDERNSLRVVPGPDGAPTASLPIPETGFEPFFPIAFYLTAGLVFSALLAAYLTRPINLLKEGFRRLSLGEFDTHLTLLMGRRRDEVADLARDFDGMAEQLKQLIDSRDRLMHDVSHELRSPLARMDVVVALARLEGGHSGEAFDRIEMESARINSIVSDLLSLSRAESEAAGAQDTYFDLADLLRVVCDDAVFEAQMRDVAVDLALDDSLTRDDKAAIMVGPPELLRRAIENVVRNAVRFSPKGKAVLVRASIENGETAIEVRDQGPGVSADMLQRMFAPFVKGDGAPQGVGLGLAIARRAIATYRGAIEAENQPNGGLLVRLTFPSKRS